MQREDTLPWYRHFWPWFVIALLGSAVTASLYTVSLAYRTTDSLVIAGEDGVDVIAARYLAAEKRALDAGIAANLQIDAASGAITATLRSDDAIDWPASLELELSHPTNVRLDQSVTLAAAMPDEAGNAVFAGHFVSVPEGRWYLVLHADNEWRLNTTWSGSSSVQLLPASAGADSGG